VNWISDARPTVAKSYENGAPKSIAIDPLQPEFEPARWSIPFKPAKIMAIPQHGWRLRVTRGMLEIGARGVSDTLYLEPAELRKRAIYLLNSSGVIYGGAIPWCLENNVLLAMRVEQDDIFNVDHRTSFVVLTEENILQKPTTRARQYAAAPLPIAKALLREQFRRMAKELKSVDRECARYELWLNKSRSIRELMHAEGHVARTYWHLRAFRLQFSDDKTFPTRWRVFRQRKSRVLGSNNQNATHPINALLNYSYAIVAAQLRRAIVASGLDPCFGYLHADLDYRDNLAYDLMELLRCRIDTDVLSWARRRVWKRSDFFVFLNGVVRLPDELAAALVPVALRTDAELECAIALMLRWIRLSSSTRTRQTPRTRGVSESHQASTPD